jgi:hypothetical protein
MRSCGRELVFHLRACCAVIRYGICCSLLAFKWHASSGRLKLLRDVVGKKLDFYLQRHILRKIQIRFCVVFLMSFVVELDVKATLVQAYSGPELFSRLRLADFITTGTRRW